MRTFITICFMFFGAITLQSQTNDGSVEYKKGYAAAKEQNYTDAMKWYKLAIAKGNIEAMRHMGWIYEYGRGVAKSYPEAVIWYKKAADKGNIDAMLTISTIYREDREGITKDFKEVVSWLTKAANKGNTTAMYSLGVIYQYANGVVQNETEAKIWYQKAADNGHESSKQALQRLASTRPTTSSKAIAQTKFQSDNGDMEFQKGSNAYKAENYSEAIKLLKQSAEKGHTNAMLVIGMMYYEGKGVAQNDTEAKAWFQKLVDKGNESAKLTLQNIAKAENSGYEEFDKGVDYYKAKNFTNAFTWLKKSSDKGNADAMLVLAGMYVSGMGTTVNTIEAFNFYKKAAEKGHAVAMYMTGLFYLEGQGVAKNGPEAIKWVKKSADKGHEKAKNLLQELDKDGITDLYKGSEAHDAKNYTEAKKWYKQSADKGNQTAVIMLSALEKEMQISASIDKGKTAQVQELQFFSDNPFVRFPLYGFKDQNGKIIVAPKYSHFHKFKEGVAAVSIGGSYDEEWAMVTGDKYGFIDHNGKEIIPFKYESVKDGFYDGLAAVKFEKKWGYIDKAGKVIIPFQYSEAFIFMNGKAKVKKDGREFFIEKTGKEVK